jgi:hypothetical protein
VAGGRWQEEGIYKEQITIYLYIPQNNIARVLTPVQYFPVSVSPLSVYLPY